MKKLLLSMALLLSGVHMGNLAVTARTYGKGRVQVSEPSQIQQIQRVQERTPQQYSQPIPVRVYGKGKVQLSEPSQIQRVQRQG